MTADADVGAIVALVERCEAAAGPDRDLDVAVGATQGLRVVDTGHPLGRCCYDGNGLAVILPRYTGSLDAATSAFPDGTMYRSGHDGDGPDPSLFFCQAVTAAPGCHIVRAVADTEPLARLAAALRARARILANADATGGGA